jgi:multiple sugar transport system ATP-binding protein
MAAIELSDVSKRYGAVPVIDPLSLNIRDGEFICFLGPSGCGKSTLLRMIAGLEMVSGGTIELGNARIDHLPPGQRGVSMVFQHYALYPHMTVFNNMAFGLRNTGVPAREIEQRIAEAADILEIEEFLDRLPSQLSGGQRQRVAIGRALVKKPKAFLFDEPLSNLDAALRLRTRVELARLHQRTRATMIFVTHDQVEAMTLADRIVVMNNRRIEQVGTPLEIYQRPATQFVAGFVGAPPMNLLPVSIVAQDGDEVSIALPGGATLALSVQGLPDNLSHATLGVRAEDVRIGQAGDLPGTVQVLERLGDRSLVHVGLPDGHTLVAADTGATRLAVGDRVRLAIERARTHLFDPAGGAYHAATGAPS